MNSNHKDHSHSHDHHSGSKNIAVAFFLNFSFTIIELVGGLLTNSIAILSDALHDFGDSFSLALSWYFEKISKRSPNKRFTYGYKRFSLVGAMINSVVLLVGSTIVVIESVKRVFDPQEIHAQGMFFLAILGVVINGIAVLRTRKGTGVNERVVSLHLLEDVLGWIAVLIVSIVMLFVDVPVLDPLLSIGISVFVLYNVYRNLKVTFTILLQGVPADVDLIGLQQKLQALEGVESVHDLHVWSLDSEYNIASLHAVIPQPYNNTACILQVKSAIKTLLSDEGIPHATIEFETAEEVCSPCDSEI